MTFASVRIGMVVGYVAMFILGLLGCATVPPSIPAQAPAAPFTETEPPSPTVPTVQELASGQSPTATSATPSPIPTQPILPTQIPSPTASATPAPPTVTASPTITGTPGPAQVCADLYAEGKQGIFIVYLRAEPELEWDLTPRWFKVGLCNTRPPDVKPLSRYQVTMHFPGGNHGAANTPVVTAQLVPGMNEVNVGPWLPGLENHVTICSTRAIIEFQVLYNDVPELIFAPLHWADSKDTLALPIKCGGNYS